MGTDADVVFARRKNQDSTSLVLTDGSDAYWEMELFLDTGGVWDGVKDASDAAPYIATGVPWFTYDECLSFRHYRTFSFLSPSTSRGDVYPLLGVEGSALRRHQTEQLVATIGNPVLSKYNAALDHHYGYGRMLYSLEELLGFDYDQPLRRVEQAVTDAPETVSYRDTLCMEYFRLLDWMRDNRWEFVIFGFAD